MDKRLARYIIETVGSHGTPPEWGFQYFTAGIDSYLQVLEEEYVKTYIREDGGATFKLVVGSYGGGKTHFLYAVRDIAWRHNYLVSYVPLSQDEAPFHKLELVYKSILKNIMLPQDAQTLINGAERGIEALLKSWFSEQGSSFEDDAVVSYLDSITSDIENTNFANAIRHAFLSLKGNNKDDFRLINQWLKMEGYVRNIYSRFDIYQPIDRSEAFPMIRSLLQFTRNAGYSGLVFLFDEAEVIPSLSSKQREQMLGNLREIIDACGNLSFRNIMIFYAIPDENFFEGRSNVYEALKQRISTIFDFFNPTGVKIRLDHLELDPVPLLVRIGLRLSKIYEVGYTKFGIDDPSVIAGLLDQLAKKAYEQRFGDIGYKRIFVQAAVRLFHLIRYAPENARDRGIVEKALSGVDANPITVASSADMKTDEDEIIDFTDSRNDSDDDSA